MRPDADAPPPMKVRRAHLASLNLCRLFGGRSFKIKKLDKEQTFQSAPYPAHYFHLVIYPPSE